MVLPMLHIRLLGELDIRAGEKPLAAMESARVVSLLAYLLLHRDTPQPRQHLAFTLWPDSTESQARTNLRHVLHNLRGALPDLDRFVEATPQTLRWRADAPFWLDIAAFEGAIQRAGRDAAGGDMAALREAVELYRGDLLPASYDDWLSDERDRLRQEFIEALERLATTLAAGGHTAEALPYAERLLRQDPLREEIYRLLMRLHEARGDRARALRVYHDCAATLERELGVGPSAPTRAAYEALLPEQREAQAPERGAGQAGLPPLIGRAAEWQRLAAAWYATEAGRAQAVLLTGEAGIGKTRLAEELRSWCAHRGADTAEARSYAAEGALAYAPVVAWLRAPPFRSHTQRLSRAHLSELGRLLPELHPEPGQVARPQALTEAEQRQRLFDALAAAILAPPGPLLLVADDLQWWDGESLQFLHYLVRVQPEARLLVAATARREDVDEAHPLQDTLSGLNALGCLMEIELRRLSREDTAALAQWFSEQALEDRDAAQLYDETEGNPLFVIEALRAGWKGGRGGWTSPKVQAVIEQRLAQLSEPARSLVGVAATVGRGFTAEMLAQAGDGDEETLVKSLDELWQRRIIREQGADGYDFSHDKVREVAYLRLSPARRRHHHLRVARALEQLHAGDPELVSGDIARHYDHAGNARAAIAWYRRAAETAQQLALSADADRFLSRALDLVRRLPATAGRQRLELDILAAMPGALVAVEGYASKRLGDLQQRASELALGLGIERPAPVLRSLATASLSRSDFDAARQAGTELYTRAERGGDEALLVEAEYVLGIAAFWSGELEAARRHFEAAVDHYRPEQRRAHLVWFGQDPKVICLSRLGNTLWMLGEPEAAFAARDAALALADEIAHPYSRSTALSFAALLALEMGDVERVRQYVAADDSGRGQDEAKQSQLGRQAFAGYLEVIDGRAEEGVRRIQRALEDPQGTDHAPGQTAMLARWLLQACAAAGDARTGLAAADRALGTGVRLWDAEAHRFRAVFLEALGASRTDVEAELAYAIEIARRQGAKTFEERAEAALKNGPRNA